MAQFEIDNRQFQSGRLNAFDQIHVFRRMAPLLQGMGETFAKLPSMAAPQPNGEAAEEPNPDASPTADVSDEELWSSFGPIAEALAKLSDADVNYVLNKCCSVTAMKNDTGGWVPIMPHPGRLQFDFLDMTALFQITLAVLQENFAGFFPAPRPLNSPPAGSPPTSPSPQ